MKKYKYLFNKLKLLVFGYQYNLSIDNIYDYEKETIVYNVHNSLPETNNGYAMRTHTIAKAIQFEGMKIKVVTRAAFPLDFNFLQEYHNSKNLYIVDNVQYFRLKDGAYYLGRVTDSQYLNRYVDLLIKFAKEHNASLLHSASNYLNGLAGVTSANILNIPSIYEVRGFWEITKASREPAFKNSLGYKLQKKLEIQACEDATSVIALSEVVKEELISRGIKKDKIYVVPNGVDTDRLKPLTKDISIVDNLGLKDKFVIGFIGSVVDYEGLQLLVEVAKRIDKQYQDKFRYLIVGDGNDLDNLKQKVKKYGIEKLFIFTGRVPYEEVEKYYSVLDIACYPRLDWEVCRIVSPKKPFEAMAYGIPVISSSVRANSYFIEDGINGLVHEVESIVSLNDKILALYTNEKLRNKIAKNAREWVVNNRDSKNTGKLLKSIYQETTNKFYGMV